jgi:tyrosyl-tRNA synthetase
VALVHAAEFPLEAEIAALKAEVEGGRNPKDAKVALAKEITARFHSAAAAEAAEQDFINRSKGGVPDDIPSCSLPLGEGGAHGHWRLAEGCGLAASTGEGNRLIDGGGVRVDSSVVSDKGLKLGAGTYVLQVGKRKFARVTRGRAWRVTQPARAHRRPAPSKWPSPPTATACTPAAPHRRGWP